MHEIASDNIKTYPLDHHGLVAATCKKLKIADKIDALLPPHKDRVVSAGKAVSAMILNGLGFTNRRLYLTPQFFESKPVEALLDAPIKADDLTDYTLGHALDEIHQYGATNLFADVAFDIALENNLLSDINHLDSTSISVHGEYSQSPKDVISKPCIELNYGHSKDHRPDLKQAVLSMVVNGPSAIPIFMECLDGNSSDKSSFHQSIKKVEAFKRQIDLNSDSKWIADSALYSKDKLLKKENQFCWVTRVPETIQEAKILVKMPEDEISWKPLGDDFKITASISEYGGIQQRWILCFSQNAFSREKKTLERKFLKKKETLKNKLWHLGNQLFDSIEDAEKEMENIKKKQPMFIIDHQINPQYGYSKKGKPKKGEKKVLKGYKVESSFSRNDENWNETLNCKGRFILATNDLNEDLYPDEQVISEYKQQQKVERGFRFLKDPYFMLDSVFLKTPSRIEALMVVMALCLLVYNVSQYLFREKLKEQKETIPNQLGKEVQNPTVRWIFQIMEGIGLLVIHQKDGAGREQRMVTNINELRMKIIRLWGTEACEMYGLNQKSLE